MSGEVRTGIIKRYQRGREELTMLYQGAGHRPAVDPGAYLADNAAVAGDVTLAAGVSVWYGAVLRGDTASIAVGAGSNIQDGVVVHAGRGFPVTIGADVTVGHRAVVHGCTVEDRCLIGMGAILLNGCVIGTGSIVGAGALVPQGAVIPPGSLVVGMPGRVVRMVRPEEAADLPRSAERYRKLAEANLPRWGDRGEGR